MTEEPRPWAAALRAAMAKRGLNTGQVSYKAELSENTVRRYVEEATASPGMANMCKIVQALDLKCDELAAIFGLSLPEHADRPGAPEALRPGRSLKVPLSTHPSEIESVLTNLDQANEAYSGLPQPERRWWLLSKLEDELDLGDTNRKN